MTVEVRESGRPQGRLRGREGVVRDLMLGGMDLVRTSDVTLRWLAGCRVVDWDGLDG